MLQFIKPSGAPPVLFLLLTLVTVLIACGPATGGEPDSGGAPVAVQVRDTPTPTARATETAEPTQSETPEVEPTEIPDEEVPRALSQSFSTDFSKRAISFDEILSGGPPKDGIPAIDNPTFVSQDDANEWIGELEPVVVFEHEGEARIYPFQILTWHEIVNDVVNGQPVAVTFCPLCNTAIVFEATVEGMHLDFGTTGRLRYSNLLMYDRQTESWWQQATGQAVIGQFTGQQLATLPAPIVSWEEARTAFPEAQVLSRDTGFRRSYGQNPYTGYDNINSSPFLFRGPITPEEMPPMARVTTVTLNDEAVAYPEEVLQEVRVVNDSVGGVDVVVFWQEGLASALDSSAIAAGRDVGATAVFERALEGQTLTFSTAEDGAVVDEQTGSEWNVLGQAVSGELTGQQLEPVVKIDHFWFSWAAFRPDTRIYQP
jgi:hypothetical protein